MVGVAGKSKGCTTCRRRKVRCDEAKPQCERCKRSNRECEGYEKYPVFITRTQKGYTKRAPLEEVKATKPAPKSAGVLTLRSPDAEATRLIAWFWESFARAPPSQKSLQSSSHWLHHYMNWTSSLPPLRQGLLAVSVTRWGRLTNRSDALVEGRRMYTESLGLTRKALLDPKLALHDEVLAAICVMTLYELFDSTTENLDGWLDHLSGIYRLLQHRGPKLHCSPASHAIFEHARYLIMLQHLVSRKACMLSTPEWLEQPWQSMEKSIEQQVFDNGLKLAAVFERCDLATKMCFTNVDFAQLFTDCVEIFDSSQRLRENFVPHTAPMVLDMCPESDAELAAISDPATTILDITALGIQLGACVSACDVYLRISEVFTTSCDTTPRSVIEQAKLLFNARRHLARQIVSSVATCINERIGAVAAARMSFSLRMAIAAVQFDPSSPEKAECVSLLKQLSSLGHRFQGLMKAKHTDTSANGPEEVDLVGENAAALAAQWQHLADIQSGTTPYPHWMPLYVEDVPCEALATWAR